MNRRWIWTRVVSQLRQYPPLVTPWEIDRLQGQLAEASVGKRFLLQGGDCAETVLMSAEGDVIANRLKVPTPNEPCAHLRT